MVQYDKNNPIIGNDIYKLSKTELAIYANEYLIEQYSLYKPIPHDEHFVFELYKCIKQMVRAGIHDCLLDEILFYYLTFFPKDICNNLIKYFTNAIHEDATYFYSIPESKRKSRITEKYFVCENKTMRYIYQ
jgi:hypothetical protein